MQLVEEQAYWSQHFAQTAAYVFYDENEFKLIIRLLSNGELAHKRVLEIGCGAGVWTANLARQGVDLYHFDLAPSIVQAAQRAAAPYPTYGFTADMHILPFGNETFDAVMGSMVIHHALDHAWLGREVARVLKPGGCAVFHENSASNPLLMLARATLVGRFGIPKNSSPGEHPLRADEVALFAKAFASQRTYIGRMVLAQLAVKYLLKREDGALFTLARWFDNWIYRVWSGAHAWSYYQILAFHK